MNVAVVCLNVIFYSFYRDISFKMLYFANSNAIAYK